jgi:hypothetical protein
MLVIVHCPNFINLFGQPGSHTEDCFRLSPGFADHSLIKLSLIALIFTQDLFL